MTKASRHSIRSMDMSMNAANNNIPINTQPKSAPDSFRTTGIPTKIRKKRLFYTFFTPFLYHFYTFFTHFLKTAAPPRTPAP